jgi:hypothetical protein
VTLSGTPAVIKQRSSSEPIRQRPISEKTNVKKHSVSAPRQRYTMSQTLVPKHITTSAPLQSPDTAIKYSRSFPRTRFVQKLSSSPDHGYSFYDPDDPPKDKSSIFDIYVDHAEPHSEKIHQGSLHVIDKIETPILIIVSSNTQDVGEIFNDPIIIEAYNEESWKLIQRKIEEYNSFIESIVNDRNPEARTGFEQAIIDLDSYYRDSSEANKQRIEGNNPYIQQVHDNDFYIRASTVPHDLSILFLHSGTDGALYWQGGHLKVLFVHDAYGINFPNLQTMSYEFPIRYDRAGIRTLVEKDEYGDWN